MRSVAVAYASASAVRSAAVQSAVPPAPARLPLSAVELNEMDVVFRYGASAAAMGALGIGTPRGFVQGVFPGRGRGKTEREEGQRRFKSRLAVRRIEEDEISSGGK